VNHRKRRHVKQAQGTAHSKSVRNAWTKMVRG
jgi:hypothetical protein